MNKQYKKNIKDGELSGIHLRVKIENYVGVQPARPKPSWLWHAAIQPGPDNPDLTCVLTCVNCSARDQNWLPAEIHDKGSLSFDALS